MPYQIGNRICIIGPSSSGKSTLAEKIAEKKNLNLLHIDQIFHAPHTNWKPRDPEEFKQLLDEFIEKDNWVIDGSYGKSIPQRFSRADTVIFIKINRFTSLYRFIKRSLANDPKRAGKLEGSEETINWKMIKFIFFKSPKKQRSYYKLITQYPHLNVIRLHNFKEIDALVASL